MKKQLVIFDCFGVIFDDVAPMFLRKYLGYEEAEKIKDEIFLPADLGKISYDQLMDNLALAVKGDREKVIEEWDSLFVLKASTVELIKKLKETSHIALLSNAPSGLVEKLFEQYDLMKLFDSTVISSVVKMAKPDPEIYKYCLSLFDEKHEKVYMIDDNINNLKPLPDLGITPVHFTDIGEVAKVLGVR